MFLEIIEKKGFFDDAFFRRSLENVFHSKDITLDITLKEFYEFSNIELHMFTIRISDFKTIDYSYKTHPDMKLLHAIYHTCTIPYLFKPHWYNNDYYIDGGLLNNYPVQECITNGAEKNEILGIRNHSKHPTITQKSNIFELCYYIHRHLSNIARTTHITLENEIHIPYTVDNINTFLDVMKNSNVRALHIKKGEDVAQHFLEKSTKIT